MSTSVTEGVTWDSPAHPLSETFFHDQMHNPFAFSKLVQDTNLRSVGKGMTAAMNHYQLPLSGMEIVFRNNYQFDRYVPRIPANEAEAKAMGERAEAEVGKAMHSMLSRWNDEELPAILVDHDRLRKIASLTPREAASLENVRNIVASVDDMWAIHFRIVIPMLLAMQLFRELYQDLFGEEGDPYLLISGTETRTTSLALAMTDLVAKAKQLGISQQIANSADQDMASTLEGSVEGQAYLAEINNFLELYGYRTDDFDLATTTWIEDPAKAFVQLRALAASGRDNRAEYDELVRANAAAVSQVLEDLASYPEAVRGQFGALMELARQGTFLQEEHNGYIDQEGTALARLAYLNVGRGLVEAGKLSSPDDIFHLTLKDLEAAVNGISRDYEAVVAANRADLEASKRLVPPPFIGPPPAGPPPTDNPMARALGAFFGGPPQESGDPNLIQANPGSRGTITGRAFVARTLDETHELAPGDILVTVTTMPPWTPLFGIAGGVVTETGGPLSHSAIVAREYGIPAVVGAAGATQRIRTGQIITIDGVLGTVALGD